MSLYHIMNGGVNQSTFHVLPMLGMHPNEYPRFRDCFINDSTGEYNDHIIVFTRNGAISDDYKEMHEKLLNHENYVAHKNSAEDSTYMTYYFSVPEKWRKEYNEYKSEDGIDVNNISEEYVEQIKSVYPKIASTIDKMYKNEREVVNG